MLSLLHGGQQGALKVGATYLVALFLVVSLKSLTQRWGGRRLGVVVVVEVVVEVEVELKAKQERSTRSCDVGV